MKQKYFVRIKKWDWLDEETITLIDDSSPKMITLEPMMQLVYLEADGQLTVQKFLDWLSQEYEADELPENFEEEMIGLLMFMAENGLIQFADEQVELDDEIKLPQSEL